MENDIINETIPDELFHYTSISTLALILKNRSIRFRRLDLMDDPNESMSSDFGRQGKYIMISCWTSKKEEELLTWSLYTNDLHGVRIGLPISPFEKRFRVTQKQLSINISDIDEIDSYISHEHIFNDRYNVPGIDFENSLVRVQYSDDPRLLNPRVNYGNAILLSELGKYKHTIWKSQEEWRYSFPVFPMTREMQRKLKEPNGEFEFGKLMMEALWKEQDPGIQHLDIPISDESIKKMSIVIGPRTDAAEEILLNSLLKEFAPWIIPQKSSIYKMIV